METKMKLRTQNPEQIAAVVATPSDKPLTGVEAITDAEVAKIHERNDIERRGFVFVGSKDGGDLYIDMSKENAAPAPYQYPV